VCVGMCVTKKYSQLEATEPARNFKQTADNGSRLEGFTSLLCDCVVFCVLCGLFLFVFVFCVFAFDSLCFGFCSLERDKGIRL